MPSDDAGYGALEQAAVLKVEVKVSMIKQLDNEVAMKSSENSKSRETWRLEVQALILSEALLEKDRWQNKLVLKLIAKKQSNVLDIEIKKKSMAKSKHGPGIEHFFLYPHCKQPAWKANELILAVIKLSSSYGNGGQLHHQTTTKHLMEIDVDDHFKTKIMVDDLVNQGEAETKQQLTVTETSFSQVFTFN